MGYTFRVVFSGPCAYVPNIVEGDEGPAKSWSVILPNIRKRWPGEKKGDKVAVDPHRAVVQFSRDKFITSAPADIDLTVRDPGGSVRESGIFLLDGHRITFDLPGARDLDVINDDIEESMADQNSVLGLLHDGDDRLRRSMQWLPAMSWLREDLQWFGIKGVNFFRKKKGEVGFPQKGTIAGHVLLTKGSLGTHEIDTVPKKGRPTNVPTIWEFRPYGADVDTGIRSQALAKSIALEASDLELPVRITLTYRPGTYEILTLKREHCKDVVEIEIKNRELEEIFLPRDESTEIERYPVDLDFRYMYTRAKGYNPKSKNYPLPHLIKGGDVGTEAATCGGVKPTGFADEHRDMVNTWI